MMKTVDNQAFSEMNPTDNHLDIIIPAHNEEAYLADCLQCLLDQKGAPLVNVILIANACNDGTVQIAQDFANAFATQGWKLNVIETDTPGKLNALNLGEQSTRKGHLVYLDADVRCDPQLLRQLTTVLDAEAPVYATGTLQVVPARSWVTRRYRDIWINLPFMKSKAVGAGLFAVNQAGRARWGVFPSIISDDTFVRLHFSEQERQQVPAYYHWPLVEGFSNLVRVRHRQDTGVRELREQFPTLFQNEHKQRANAVGLFLARPISFVVYALVSLAVRLSKKNNSWTRGR